MSDIGFAGDIGDRYFVAQLAPAQVGVQNHGKFIRWAKATGTRHRTNNHWPGVFEKFFVVLIKRLGVVHAANGMGKSPSARIQRPSSGNFAKRQLRTGGDHHIVVVHGLTAFKRDSVGIRVNVANCFGNKVNPLAG